MIMIIFFIIIIIISIMIIMMFAIPTLQKTPTLVSADVATVLRVSRFGKHFEFHPLDPGTNAPADDVYNAADPFAYCVANNVKKASGGCCPKPTEQKSGGGCRPKSAEKESACGAKRPKIESEGTCCWLALLY